VHGSVPCPGTLSQPAGARGRGGGVGRGQWHRRGRLRGGRLGLDSGAQAVMVCGDGLLRCLAQVLPQVEPVGNLNRLRGSGADALGVRTGPLSLHTVWTSGCSRSQAASVAASRSGSTSTGLRVSMSIKMVLYDWPRRTAKSSTSSRCARGAVTGRCWSTSRPAGRSTSWTTARPTRSSPASRRGREPR
jgi:hypothetical protein